MKKGFTLIELMIVIAIIAILAAIAVPNFGRMKDKAAVQSAARSIEGLKYALEVYRDEPDNNGLFPALNTVGDNPFNAAINLDITQAKMQGTLRGLQVDGDTSGFSIWGKPKLNDTTTRVFVNDFMNNAIHNYRNTTTIPAVAGTVIFGTM